MIRYYITLLDELGDDFGISITLPESIDVVEWISEQYPESTYISIKPYVVA